MTDALDREYTEALFREWRHAVEPRQVTHDLSQPGRANAVVGVASRMNEFIAMLSHELRNPLAPGIGTLIGNSDGATDGPVGGAHPEAGFCAVEAPPQTELDHHFVSQMPAVRHRQPQS